MFIYVEVEDSDSMQNAQNNIHNQKLRKVILLLYKPDQIRQVLESEFIKMNIG